MSLVFRNYLFEKCEKLRENYKGRKNYKKIGDNIPLSYNSMEHY
jgi:hypothetical protein